MRTRLVERARDGDDVAFAELVDLDGDRCYAIAYRILRDAERAQDAVQQAFLLAWRELPNLRDPDRFGPWLHRLLVNACYEELRRHRRWATRIRSLPVDGPGGPDTTVSVDDRDTLDRAFLRLTPEHRSVFVLHHHAGLALGEIADVVGVPLGTVKSRLHYATQSLRAAIVADSQVEIHGGTTGVNVQRDPDTILAAWLDEGPDRLPESTRRAIVVNVRTTHQTRRRIRLPWRFPPMNGMSRFAFAAVAVLAVALGGLYLFNANGNGVGGQPAPSPTPRPTPSPSPSPTPPPALTESFTSAIHGISVSYPAGWTIDNTATQPWTTGLPNECEPASCGDQIAAVRSGSPFLNLASQPLGGQTGEQWATQILEEPAFDSSCPPATEPVSIDGAPGMIAVLCPDGGLTALTWVDDRGYLIVLYDVDDKDWFKEILATVRLDPAAAVGPSASPSGSPSPAPSTSPPPT